MRTRRIVAGIAAGVAVLIAGLFLYHPAVGTFNRLFRMPAIVRAPFIEPLSESAVTAKVQREQFVDAWRNRRNYGLHKVQKTIEGTPVGLWLITSQGGLTLVTDYTRDSYSTRAIDVARPILVELGPPTQDEQHPLRAWFPDSSQVYVRCKLATDRVEFF